MTAKPLQTQRPSCCSRWPVSGVRAQHAMRARRPLADKEAEGKRRGPAAIHGGGRLKAHANKGYIYDNSNSTNDKNHHSNNDNRGNNSNTNSNSKSNSNKTKQRKQQQHQLAQQQQ